MQKFWLRYNGTGENMLLPPRQACRLTFEGNIERLCLRTALFVFAAGKVK
jgi:hypothetical protein